MLFRAPKFWYGGPQWLSYMLLPFSLLYQAACNIIKLLKQPQKIDIPVIYFGNAVLGGSGKTSAVLSLVNILQQQGYQPHIVMRGYKGSIKSAHYVNLNCDTCKTVGDEALMVAAYAPTWVARNRYEGALASQRAGAQLIILDDGLQNYDLEATIKILVVNAMQHFGNNRVFPAGPLREKVANIVKRCQGVVLIDHDPLKSIDPHLNTMKLWHAVTKPQLEIIEKLKLKKLYAFSGIGFNDKFFNMLNHANLNIVKTFSYPDHYYYLNQDLNKMLIEAQVMGATLVATTKDWQRLDDNWRTKIIHIPISLEFHNQNDLLYDLLSVIKESLKI